MSKRQAPWYAAGSCLVLAAAVLVLRLSVVASWPVIAATAIALIGAMLWLPSCTEQGALGNFGSALATGAVVSGMFLVLTERDTSNQNRLAAAQQTVEQTIAHNEELTLQLTIQHTLVGVNLSNQDLSNQGFNMKDMADADMYGADLTGTRMLGTRLNGASLNGATLTKTYLRSADLQGATLEGADGPGADFDESDLVDANFGFVHENNLHRPADLAGATLLDANARGACFAGANLRGAKFGGANLYGADLDGTDLRGAMMAFAGLPANLVDVSIWGAKIDPSQLSYFRRAARVTPALMRTLATAGRVPPSTRTGRVTGVYDGQIVDIGGLGWARLIGILAPNPSEPDGPQARSLLSSAFGTSEVIRYLLGRVPREARWGGTGRWLIYAWNSHGTFVNEASLQSGYSIRRADADEGGLYDTVLDAAQLYARASGKGLWAICPSPQH